MKRLLVSAFCSLLLLAALTAKANAQATNAQAHVAIAKAAAYEPGQDLPTLFEMCAEQGPGRPAPAPQAAAAAAPRRVVPIPRDQWYTEPAKVFDNLYYVGATRTTDVTI